MALIIFWNGLYHAKRKQWNLVARCIRAHFGRKKLWKRNVKFAVIRPTGWHGESGRANWGGHVTVDFRTQAHVHVSTHHVYRTEAAYGEDEGRDEAACLVLNYLIHHGYAKTAKALQAQLACIPTRAASPALPIPPPMSMSASVPADADSPMMLVDHKIESGEPSMLEQHLSIVRSVLPGDIEGALNELGEHFPDFVELVNAAAEAIRALLFVRSSELIRSQVVQAGTLDVVGCILESWLASKGFAVGPSSSATSMPRETREQHAVRKQVQAEMRAHQQATELARALKRRQDIPHNITMQAIHRRSCMSELTLRAAASEEDDRMDTSVDSATLSDDSSAMQADISGVDSPTPAPDAALAATGSDPDTSTDTSRHQTPAGSNTPTGTVEVPGRN
ncbi:hypothetical protein EDB85DRAFT_2222926 [Lactarius pseudohatsudake]|nr:hypothetical protein EDB85DRAFT_2222926 [Lactarius pseudohatsudake]